MTAKGGKRGEAWVFYAGLSLWTIGVVGALVLCAIFGAKAGLDGEWAHGALVVFYACMASWSAGGILLFVEAFVIRGD